MIIRIKSDFSWPDTLFALINVMSPGKPESVDKRIKALWADHFNTVTALSVRSGFDMLLRSLNFPKGGEILTSAVNIPDMITIIKNHGLTPRPIDINMSSLSLKTDCLEKNLTPNTKAILVAHLFGSRDPLDEIFKFAKKHSLFLIEDSAQVFSGVNERVGHPESDAVMFSFGPNKRATAFGGAILRLKDLSLSTKIENLQLSYPVQKRGVFFNKVVKCSSLKFVSHPKILKLFIRCLNILGTSYDDWFLKITKNFGAKTLSAKLRHRPSYPLLALLERRLKNFNPRKVEKKLKNINLLKRLSPDLEYIGKQNADHSHLLFPVLVQNPEKFTDFLRKKGFDASSRTSCLAMAESSGKAEVLSNEAGEALDKLVYLPVHHDASYDDIKRLSDVIAEISGGPEL